VVNRTCKRVYTSYSIAKAWLARAICGKKNGVQGRSPEIFAILKVYQSVISLTFYILIVRKVADCMLESQDWGSKIARKLSFAYIESLDKSISFLYCVKD
jgi:hypothetical protein